jgi:hypothetical protein
MQARADLEKLKSQLRLVEQPHAFLLDAVRARDEQLSVANKVSSKLFQITLAEQAICLFDMCCTGQVASST